MDYYYKIKPLAIIFLKMSSYVKIHYGEPNWINILIEVDELLKKKNDIWNKVSNNIKKGFNLQYKFLKSKTKFYSNNSTDFHDKDLLKVGSNYICLAVILIDFVLKKDQTYYPQVILKECKYIDKEIRNIAIDPKAPDDDSDKEGSDKED